MPVTVQRTALSKALTHVAAVVPRKSTVPVCTHVLLTAGDSTLTLQGTDFDIEVSMSIPAEVDGALSLTTSAYILLQLVRTMKDAELTFTPEANGSLLVTAGKSRFSLPSFNGDEYPSTGAHELPTTFEMPSAELARLFAKTAFATSHDDIRYYLNGVFMHSARSEDNASVLRCCATNGNILARADAPLPDGVEALEGIIIPTKAVTEISKLCGACERITVSVSSRRIQVDTGEVVLSSKVIDGTFPDCNRIIPTERGNKLTIATANFLGAVKRVSILLSEVKRVVKVAVSQNEICIETAQQDGGAASETLDAEWTAEPFEIGFHAGQLASIVGAINGTNLSLEMAQSYSPAVVTDPADRSSLYILMPLRV